MIDSRALSLPLSSLCLILLLSLLPVTLLSQTPGVTVENVAPASEAVKAGLRAGDVLQSWDRGDVTGRIESPFDLAEIEVEQEPRGTLILAGVRGREQFRWTMGPGSWGMDVRPSLTEPQSTAYREGQDLAEGGNTLGAALRWREAAAVAKNSSLAVWFLWKAAGLLDNKEQWKDADSAYVQALYSSDSSGVFTRVQVLRAWALSHQQRHNWADAERYFNQALALYQQSGAQNLTVATLLNDLGNVIRSRGDIAAAEENYRKALAIAQQLAPESRIAAASLHGLGFVAFEKGDVAEAESYYLQALKIRERLVPGSLELANTLNNLANVNQENGDLTKAEEYQRRALQIKETLAPDSLAVANSLNNIGLLEFNRGDLAAAEMYHRKALEIRERLAPDGPGLIDSYGNLGQLAEARGDLSAAKRFYSKAVIIAQKLVPGSLDLARIYESIANVTLNEGNFRKAELFYHKAYTIKQARAPGGLDMAWTLHNLGSLFAQTHRYAKAEKYFRESLTITRKLAPNSPIVTQSLLDLGELASVRGQATRAAEFYSQARGITARIAPKSSAHAQALAGLAVQMGQKRQFAASLDLYAAALDALEGQVAQLGGSEQIQSEFRAKRAAYYRDYIDLLMHQRKPRAAFQTFERLRARSLLELLTEAHLDFHNGVDPQLLSRERALQAALTRLSNRRIQVLTNTKDDGQIAACQKEIDDVLTQYQEVREQIRMSSPRYADLTQPRPLAVDEVQQLLDRDTLLLEYSLGVKRSYLWALTSKTLTTFTLPRRAVIDRLARRFYILLSTRSAVRGQQARVIQKTGAALSNILLGPTLVHLKAKRLLVVSDGALQYVPFAALPLPGRAPGITHYEPLMVTHEIMNLPSATVLAELRRETTEHAKSSKIVAVLADPVFDSEDVRVHKAASIKPAGISSVIRHSSSIATDLLTRSAADAGVPRGKGLLLPRLPFSRREALSILSVTPAGLGMAALDFQASRPTVLSEDLRHYQIVHFATHGLVDSKRPALSGIVLSLVDQDGNQLDGFLSLQEIYNLDMPVELVVLSACETALGKEIDGEGLIGMTRGFMYAGASHVMASLWNINDVATVELMARFYSAVEQGHMGFAAALREAQLNMWKSRRWNDPFYWAAFQLQGDSK